MQPYQPVSPRLYEALEEIHALRSPCTLSFLKDGQRLTLRGVRLTDLYSEDDGQYLLIEGTQRLRLDQLVALNGQAVQSFA